MAVAGSAAALMIVAAAVGDSGTPNRDSAVSNDDDWAGPHADVKPRPRVSGYVRDDAGRPISGALVNAHAVADVDCRLTERAIGTNAEGQYFQSNIRCGGTYQLVAIAAGYDSDERIVKVPTHGALTVDFSLRRLP